MEMARIDHLTGCFNRLGGMATLDDMVEARRRFAVLVVDIDGFKAVNDHHGHATGDLLLIALVARFRAQLRYGDVLARIGGDEFVVLVPDTDIATAAQLAAGLVEVAGQPFEIDGRHVRVGASIGIAMCPDHAEQAETLLGYADIAMYSAKRTGGHQTAVFNEGLSREAARTYEIVTGLRDALDNDGLALHYQPQFDLDTLEPVGLEALVRWVYPERGAVRAEEFVEIALDWGVMPLIGRWALRRAAMDHAGLLRSGVLAVPVAVNICAPLIADREFIPFVTAVLDESGLDPAMLEIEIIEQVAMIGSPQLTRNLDELLALGVTISMDDFGTGYSSMAQLKSERFGKLKIDRSFVAALPDSAADAVLVNAMISIGRGLGLPVVAEGIESEEQRAFLLAQGCRLGQGYALAEPMPLDQLMAWLVSRQQR